MGMNQPYAGQQQVSTRKALLVFLKNVGPPIVLYVDNPDEAYVEIKKIMTNANQHSPKLIEKVGKGPVKRLAVFDTQIAGAVIQEEPTAQ